MHEENIILKTNDGNLDCRIFKNKSKNAPSIIFYMDAPAIREELRQMCRIIVNNGYNVLLPNLFYRIGTENNYPFNQDIFKNSKEELNKMIKTMNDTTNTMIVEDTKYLIEYLSNNFKNSQHIGILGYCMSGRFVISCAAKYSKTIIAAASFYGVDIVTKNSDSPHLLVDKIKAELYLAFAEKDIWVPEKIVNIIKTTFKNKKNVIIDTYLGTDHGFAFPNRSTYVKDAADRHWNKLLDLFERNLKK